MTYWKDTLLVGVDKIDVQHKQLVGAIDALMEACSKGQGRASIENTLRFVSDYTKQHFSDEEKIQAQYGYPGMAAHKKLHAQFISSVTDLMNDFEKNGPNIALTGKMNKTLVEWLIKHISNEDKKIGEYIRQKEKAQ